MIASVIIVVGETMYSLPSLVGGGPVVTWFWEVGDCDSLVADVAMARPELGVAFEE